METREVLETMTTTMMMTHTVKIRQQKKRENENSNTHTLTFKKINNNRIVQGLRVRRGKNYSK